VATTAVPSAVGLFNCHVRLVIRQARGRWGLFRRSVPQLHGKSREFTVDMKDSPRTLDELVLHRAWTRLVQQRDAAPARGVDGGASTTGSASLPIANFDDQDRPSFLHRQRSRMGRP